MAPPKPTHAKRLPPCCLLSSAHNMPGPPQWECDTVTHQSAHCPSPTMRPCEAHQCAYPVRVIPAPVRSLPTSAIVPSGLLPTRWPRHSLRHRSQSRAHTRGVPRACHECVSNPIRHGPHHHATAKLESSTYPLAASRPDSDTPSTHRASRTHSHSPNMTLAAVANMSCQPSRPPTQPPTSEPSP